MQPLPTFNDHLRAFLPQSIANRFASVASVDDTRASSSATPADLHWATELSDDELEHFLTGITSLASSDWKRFSKDMSACWVAIIRRTQRHPVQLSAGLMSKIAAIYGELSEFDVLRALLLRFLLTTRQVDAFVTFAHLLTAHPLDEDRLLLEVFGDLLRLGNNVPEVVVTTLVATLDSPRQAVFVLDYANHCYRAGRSREHPAKPHLARLIAIQSKLADRLGNLQQSKPISSQDVVEIGRQVNEGVSLSVAICDALGLIGDQQAIACLNKTMQVQHRRLRVEAISALAKLGVTEAEQGLVELAAEPAERLRVLAYAEELGLQDRIGDQYAGPTAIAEAELVTFLMQPTQFGMPPSHIELVDRREQAWPGFDDPPECYLFQYVYQLQGGELINIGIAGPLVTSLPADLTELPHDDIYALFAGSDVDHADIFAVEPHKVVGREQARMRNLLASVADQGLHSDLQIALWGHLLDTRLLVVAARRDHELGWAVVSDDAYAWIPRGNPERPLSALDAFFISVGRVLLSTFN